MTIQQSIRKKLRRYALFCLMAASSAGWANQPTPLVAQETHDSGDLCGWVEESEPIVTVTVADTAKRKTCDTCNYEDWLREDYGNEAFDLETPCPSSPNSAEQPHGESVPLIANADSSPQTSRTSGSFNGTLATIAAATSAGNPVPMTQWAEPFAMVGPGINHAKDHVRALQEFVVRDWLARHTIEANWWESHWASEARGFLSQSTSNRNSAKANERQKLTGLAHHPDPHVSVARSRNDKKARRSNPEAFVPIVDFSGVLEATDSAPNPELLLVETTPKSFIPEVSGRSLVGGSAMVFSINTSDLDSLGEPIVDSRQVIWGQGIFGPPRKPFCIKAIVDNREADWSPIATRELVQPNVEPLNQSPEYSIGTAECLFDEWFWKVSVALEDVSATKRWLRPRKFGQTIATLVVGGDRLANQVARELAQAWPVPPRPAEPKRGAGAKLLARAEAAEHLPVKGAVKPLSQDVLAQARAVLSQWVAVTQNAIDEISNRWSDVAEVALNRGTQDESNRR